MGFRKERESLDLVHGEAIHRGMRELYLAHAAHGSYAVGYSRAMEEYVRYYSEHIHEDDWADNSPKNPSGASECFTQYPLVYEDDEFELLGAEIYGEIPISPSRSVLGRLDLLIKANNKVFVIDHKTSKYRLSQALMDTHEVGFQFKTYNLLGLTFVLSQGLPASAFGGVLVNHMTFLESKTAGLSVEFDRFYVRKSEQQLERHIIETECLVSEIEEEVRKLGKLRSLQEYLPLFLPNYGSCLNFFRRCDFFDFCQYHNNPLKFVQEEPPAGFKLDFWDPRGKGKKRTIRRKNTKV